MGYWYQGRNNKWHYRRAFRRENIYPSGFQDVHSLPASIHSSRDGDSDEDRKREIEFESDVRRQLEQRDEFQAHVDENSIPASPTQTGPLSVFQSPSRDVNLQVSPRLIQRTASVAIRMPVHVPKYSGVNVNKVDLSVGTHTAQGLDTHIFIEPFRPPVYMEEIKEEEKKEIPEYPEDELVLHRTDSVIDFDWFPQSATRALEPIIFLGKRRFEYEDRTERQVEEADTVRSEFGVKLHKVQKAYLPLLEEEEDTIQARLDKRGYKDI